MIPTYQNYKSLFRDEPKPFAFIDLDLLEQNIAAVIRRAGNKTIRVASKSVRCTRLLRYLLDKGAPFKGIMTYTAGEAVFLANEGFDDMLVGYPTWQEKELNEVCEAVKNGKRIILMADCAEHLNRYASFGEKYGIVLPVCLDIDMSSTFPGLYFGVYRSGLRNAKAVKVLMTPFIAHPHLNLVGIMGYEAQIAGVGDAVQGAAIKNIVVKTLKNQSIKEVALRRAEVTDTLNKMGFRLELVNGGGTGSLESTVQESAVTEVTVGSAFYSPALFDNYVQFKHLPAAGFAIEITRKPQPHIYTCAGGGYIASGSAGTDKLPKPYLPQGAALTGNEATGEVQTPIIYKGLEHLALGDPIFMRHAKAGELCERFKQLVFVSGGKIQERALTYRGQNQCFI